MDRSGIKTVCDGRADRARERYLKLFPPKATDVFESYSLLVPAR